MALADRVLLIEDGRIALDPSVCTCRGRGAAALAAIEGQVLARVLGQAPQAPPTPLADIPRSTLLPRRGH